MANSHTTTPQPPEPKSQRDERRSAAFNNLRHRAEQLLQAMDYAPHNQIPNQELAELYHDLMVFHIELDLQQDELFHSRERIEELLRENFAAFELAPFCYWKTDEKGMVHVWNLLGAELFKTPRRNLVPGKIPLSMVIHPDAHSDLTAFLRRVFTQQGVTRVKLRTRNDHPILLFGRKLPETSRLPHLALIAGVSCDEIQEDNAP